MSGMKIMEEEENPEEADLGVEDEDWYQNDLQLAAELGKTLLERNKELEGALRQAQQITEDQALEIEYLARQLEELRELSESRARLAEQLDGNCQELERTNQRAEREKEALQQRIDKLCGDIQSLEQRCEEHQATIDELKQQERLRRKRERRKQTNSTPSSLEVVGEFRRANSLDNTYSNVFLANNPYESEIKALQDQVKTAQAQQNFEKRKRDELEMEVSVLIHENQTLEKRAQELEIDALRTKELEDELRQMQDMQGNVCLRCMKSMRNERRPRSKSGESLSSLSEFKHRIHQDIEEDSVELDDTAGANGGVVNGDLDSDDKGFSTASSDLSLKRSESDDMMQNPPKSGVSLLTEIDAQYHAMKQKYETLLSKLLPTELQPDHEQLPHANSPYLRRRLKSEASAVAVERSKSRDQLHLLISKAVQTSQPVSRKTSDENIPSESSPPEYKSLFKEIFMTLRKSKFEES
ncbi:cerebellar degeneration-related protein 2-like isoform X1 [Branchiostoma floridae x Branchiostoma belcheri]